MSAAALDAARRRLESAPDDPADLATLAATAGFSRFHFLRAFRSRWGTTPIRYRTRCRLETAKRLLALTGLPVTDICLEVGFSSLGSFSTLFRRRTGMSPQLFRRRWRTHRAWAEHPAAPPVPACILFLFAPEPTGGGNRGEARPPRSA